MSDELNNPASYIIKSLGHLLKAGRQQFTTLTLEREVGDLGLFAEDDLNDVS